VPVMQIPRPGEDDKARFRSLVPADPRVEVKPMFGNLGAFVNGNMFMGLFGADVGLKLPEPEALQLRQAGGGPFGPAERPMSGYVSLPLAMTEREARQLAEQSLAYVGALPPKTPRARRKPAG
jgi:TfoX/Sxy family transcriptional regulator of competence genes